MGTRGPDTNPFKQGRATGPACTSVQGSEKQFVATHSRQHLRAQLRQEAFANADRDLAMAAEWFPLEEEAWPRATGKKPNKGK